MYFGGKKVKLVIVSFMIFNIFFGEKFRQKEKIHEKYFMRKRPAIFMETQKINKHMF